MATTADGGIMTPTRIPVTTAPSAVNNGHARTVEKAALMVDKEEEEEDRGTEEMNAPVDLVCPKHELEPTVVPSRLETIPDSSLALSLLMRRRRRGRARYAPFPCSGCTSHAPDLSPGLSSSLPGSSSLPLGGRAGTGQFVCPHCKSVFPNRDALAMHMLDSVRSDGICGGGPGNSNSGVSVSTTSTTTSPPTASGSVNGGISVSSSPTVPSATPIPIPSVPASAASQVTCRVCAKTLPSLDSLAMHMLAHAHQEGLHSVMQRVASHYSDLLQHSFVPQVPQHAPIAPMPVSAVVAPLQITSPGETKLTCPKTEVLDKNEEKDSEMVVVKVEETEDEEEGSEDKYRDQDDTGEMERETASAENGDDADSAPIGIANDADVGPIVVADDEDVEECTAGFPFVCRHCLVAFADRTMFCLHMGLHNVNHPWQCNMCGKSCSGRHEFTSHVLHF